MKKFDTINVIPFVDIMLVLLAIVLTTATFVSNGELDITLPVARASSNMADVETVEIAIDRELLFYFEGQVLSIENLKQRIATMDKATQVTLAIDEAVEFREFIAVVDALKSASIQKFSIVTRKHS